MRIVYTQRRMTTATTALAVLLASLSRPCVSNLLVNGGFTEAGYTPNPVVAASGQHGRVSVEDFPGSATAALRISPTGTAASTSATIATVAATRPVGWYKVELFVFAPTGYNGKGSPLTVDAVDGSGTTLMSSSNVLIFA